MDHADLLWTRRNAERRLVDRSEVDRLPNPFRDVELLDLRRRAALQHMPRTERLQVVEHEDVGLVAGRNCAEPPQPVVHRGIDGRHHHRVLRAHAFLDRDADHLVDVPLLDDEVGLAVVGAEHALVGAVLLHEWQQVLQVARARGLAQHDPHPKAPLLERLLESRRLVVGANAGCEVGVETRAAHAGCVPVHVIGEPRLELGELAGVAGDDAGEVHHLGDADGAVTAEEALDVARRERPPRRLE